MNRPFRTNQHNSSLIEKEGFITKSTLIKNQYKKATLITGGAGFIGTNVADRLLKEGERVIIYDNLSRDGVEKNLYWLKDKYPQVEVMIADVNDKDSLKTAVDECSHIFHFAAQVAVTTSLNYPEFDHEVNVGGTLNVLETIRNSEHRPSLIFTSTNKVYGDMAGMELKSNSLRYFPSDQKIQKHGVSESWPLNFLSPYGNSKGSADQYILDYARSYGLKNVVFRMSCIYGPHQFGTEDQGWVAHFIKQLLQQEKIMIYGDGRQVRDILYIGDLVNAFLLARGKMDQLSGEAFNIGGGPENAVSLIELLEQLYRLDHLDIQTRFDHWRTGDQKYYVSDIRKFHSKTGWKPTVSIQDGLMNLYSWLHQYQEERMTI